MNGFDGMGMGDAMLIFLFDRSKFDINGNVSKKNLWCNVIHSTNKNGDTMVIKLIEPTNNSDLMWFNRTFDKWWLDVA